MKDILIWKFLGIRIWFHCPAYGHFNEEHRSQTGMHPSAVPVVSEPQQESRPKKTITRWLPPPQVFRFYFFLIRKTHWSEDVLTSQGNCKGLYEIKKFHTLCSFSRRSGLSGTPLRLCGIYQKQTLVCSGCSGFHKQANIQIKQKSMRIWEKTVSKILCTPGGSLSD